MSTTPLWKKVYQTVSGFSRNITEHIVEEILKLSKTELLNGLHVYKPYTKEAYNEWCSKSEDSTVMKEFIFELSEDLNLDTNVTYPVMCNYLMFEYYGKIKEFWQITRRGTTINLKESIWNFYTAERMFLIKTWRHIFENLDKKEYEFFQQYKDFVNTVTVEQIQNSMLNQIEELGSEFNEINFDEKNPHLENWLSRNAREQTELILILTLTLKHRPFDVKQITKLVNFFVVNNFGATPPLFEARKYSKNQDLQDLMYAAMGCFLTILGGYWERDISDFWKDESFKEMDRTIIGLHLNPAQTIVIFSWLLLKFKNLQINGVSDRMTEIFERKPFVILNLLICSEIYKNCSVGDVVADAIHKLLDELCLLFDDRKLLYDQTGIISVLAELLKKPQLAQLTLKTRNGTDRLLETAIETFPYDFLGFTLLMEPLLGQPKLYKQTIHLLNNIPSFLSDMTWSIAKDEIYVIERCQPAFSDSDLIIFPPGTTVKSYNIFGKNLVQYKGTYSYFIFLEYLVNLMVNTGISRRKFEPSILKKVIAGYNVVMQGIKNCVDMDLKIIGLERILKKMNNLMNYMDGPLFNHDLIQIYFDVQNTMIEHRQVTLFDYLPDVLWKVFFPKLRMEYLSRDVSHLVFQHYIFEETLFMKFFKEEEYKDDHSVLLGYVKILHNTIKLKFQYKSYQLSGVAYLLNFVFLQHQSWIYKDDNQRVQITLECLKIFHYILQKDVKELNEDGQKIFKLCHHAFLHNPNIIEAFLRLFIKEKYYLMFLMERETNWIKGSSLDKLKCIQMQLALLLLIMNHQKSFDKCSFKDKLPLVVKPVASYFTNSYSPVIAELSCRFLEKLAQDPYVPLLALLELDHYQVQALFLERLRDPLEEDTVKLAILDLINTCICNQNGMTAAFFNLKCFMYWDGTENDVFSGDTVSDYMIDYLENVKKSHEYFKNPLQLGILRLLYNLWLNHRENLIDNIAGLKDFWPVMVDPFFYDFVQDIEVYTVILKIINSEISAHIGNVNSKLTNTINLFFKDKGRIAKWAEFVLKCSERPTKNSVDLLSAWLEFLVLTKKTMPDNFTTEIKDILFNLCLDGLNLPETGFNNDLENLYLWCQLYLILITSWEINEKDLSTVVSKILIFVRSLTVFYKFFTPKFKEVVLCAIDKTIINLRKYFTENPNDLLKFLLYVGQMIDIEHEYFQSQVLSIEDESDKIKAMKPWLLSIFIGNSLLKLDHLKEVAIWFSYRKLLQKVMDSVVPMLKNRAMLPFAKLATDFLVSYAQSTLHKDFLGVDLYTFYFKIQPPSLTVHLGIAVFEGIPLDLKEWWFILITLIKLNHTLMVQMGETMFDTCFTFVKEHAQMLRDLISLTKNVIDMTALTLATESLKLVYMIISFLPDWCLKDLYSYKTIMDGIKTTIHACVLSILGYKKINFYNMAKGMHTSQLSVMHHPPTDLLVPVLNKLTEIIYWACSCMRKTKPHLLAQLNSHHILEHLTLMVDNDFRVPRFEYPSTPTLAYGTLLCIADYLCKILNQLSPTTPSTTVPHSRQVSMTHLTDDIKIKSLGKIFEHCVASFDTCIGFMVFTQKTDDFQSEKLSSLLHFDMSEFSGPSTSSIVSQMDYYLVKNALEALMSFLTVEIFYAIRNMDQETLYTYKRELSSEIQFFYEFVRKRTSESYNAMVSVPRPFSALPQNEPDIVKRYMITKVSEGDTDDIADNNYILVIAQWLIKYCHLSN